MSRGFLDEDHEADRDFGALDAREVEIAGRIVERLNGALRFDSGVRVHYVPLSKIIGSELAGKNIVTLRVPERWAKKEGLI